MKIAILSDIHGNMIALNAVMDDLRRNNCEKVFFLGDYALAGPEPVATVDYCMHLNTYDYIEMIQGNTDKMIAEYTDDLYNQMHDSIPVMSNALKDDVSILTDSQKEFLRTLPAYKMIELERLNILLVHGSPRRNNEDILPDTDPKVVEEMVKDSEADIILCGHTHIPCGFQTLSKKTVINVGSVGRPFTENLKPCYLILNLDDGKFVLEHKFVDYDNQKSAEILANRNFEGSERLADILVNPSSQRHI